MALRTSVWTTAQLHSSVTHSCKLFMQPDRVDCIFINDLLHALHVRAQPRKLGMTAASSKSVPESNAVGVMPGSDISRHQSSWQHMPTSIHNNMVGRQCW